MVRAAARASLVRVHGKVARGGVGAAGPRKDACLALEVRQRIKVEGVGVDAPKSRKDARAIVCVCRLLVVARRRLVQPAMAKTHPDDAVALAS